MTTETRSAVPTSSQQPPSLEAAHALAAATGAPLGCSRRALLRRAGAGGAVLGTAGLLVACGGTGEPESPSAGGADGSSSADGSASAGASETSGGSAGSGGSVAASDVPEGQAVVVELGGEEVVLAQPTAGTYVAYSAVCPHAGGIVQADSGTEVRCPLHGSVFDAGSGGEVLQGPATTGLAALSVTAEGDQLVVG